MNSVDIALAHLTALPGWLGSGPAGFADDVNPAADSVRAAALETTSAVRQRSLEEFLR